jgi:hypothetical protein
MAVLARTVCPRHRFISPLNTHNTHTGRWPKAQVRYQNRCAHNIYCHDAQSSRNNLPATAVGAFPSLFQCPLNINDAFGRKPSKHKDQRISRSNRLPPRHVQTPQDTYSRSVQPDRRIQSSSYVYIIHFNIILPTAPVFEEAYFLQVFTPKLCMRFSTRTHMQMCVRVETYA